MAGANKILKPGQMLFRSGDQSDGMYLVRKGELKVFLEENGKEVHLTSVTDGGMIGEMAFFEQKPRSASVKATQETEVTVITNDDFAKLLKQIPKWFVTIMQALSARLRSTNERVKKLEGLASESGSPFRDVLRQLNILLLLWHKDGHKDKGGWFLTASTADQTLIEMFGEPAERIKKLFDTLDQLKIMTRGKDSTGNVCLVVSNKGVIEKVIKFMQDFAKAQPKAPCLSDESIQILTALQTIVQASAYDTVTATLADLEVEGKKQSYDTSRWKDLLVGMKGIGEGLTLVRASGGSVGLKTSKKEVAGVLESNKILVALHKAGLT